MITKEFISKAISTRKSPLSPLCQREVRRDFINNVVIITRLLIQYYKEQE